MVSGPRSRVEVLILAVLLVATGLLGSGITLAVKEAPAEPAHAAWPDSLDLDGPLTLVVDDDPFLEIDPDGTVRFLASPDLLSSLPAPKLGVLDAGAGCPDGGATITSQWGTNSTQTTVCDGGAGPTGEMGPEGMRFMVKVAPFPGPLGAECENGGYLLLMGRDTGNGAATAYDGVLDVDEIVHEIPICHGVGRVGQRGPQGEQGIPGERGYPGTDATGEPGFDTLIRTLTDGSLCSGEGGVRFEYGLDRDRSGLLDPSEVDTAVPQAYLCNGKQGEKGLRGAGVAVRKETLEAGGTCPTGGHLLFFGADDGGGDEAGADDGILQDGEVDPDATVTVCNGPEGPPSTEKGPPGPPGEGEQGDPGHSVALNWTVIPEGPTCPTGGQRVRLGVDDGDGDGAEADDGELATTEVDETVTICNGTRGDTGPPGSPGGIDQMWIPQVPDQSKGGVIDGTAPDVGEHTSITIGRDGIPIIAYYDNSSKNLKVAHCGTITCSVPTITTLDSGDDVGQYASIAIRPNGNPMIAYYDAANTALKVVECTDYRCEDSFTPTTLAGGDALDVEDVGEYVVLSMVGGTPVMDYYDATNGRPMRTACRGLICGIEGMDQTFPLVDASLGDAGRFLASTGREVAYYYEQEEPPVREIRYIRCTSALSCPVGGTWADGVQVDSRMAWVNGRVYFHFQDIDGGKYAFTESGCCTHTNVLPTEARHMAWAAAKPGESAVWVYAAEPLLGGNAHLQMLRCTGICPSAPADRDGRYPYEDDALADYAYPSVTVDPWNFPVMAYHDEAAGTLRFVRAPNPILDEGYWHR